VIAVRRFSTERDSMLRLDGVDGPRCYPLLDALLLPDDDPAPPVGFPAGGGVGLAAGMGEAPR
jgi:hypothetical protein